VLSQALYRPNLEGEELVTVVRDCMAAALERQCEAGYGMVIHLIDKNGIASTTFKGRTD